MAQRWPAFVANVAVPVREQQLGLALAARVERELAGMRVRRRVLRADAEVAIAPRDPVRLAAPAAVDDPIVEREAGLERGHRLRAALLLPARDEAHTGGDDLQHHRHPIRAESAVPDDRAPRRRRRAVRAGTSPQSARAGACRRRGCGDGGSEVSSARTSVSTDGSTSTRSASAPGSSRPFPGRRKRAAGRSLTSSGATPSVSAIASSDWQPEIPPQIANASSPFFIDGGAGEWSLAKGNRSTLRRARRGGRRGPRAHVAGVRTSRPRRCARGRPRRARGSAGRSRR